MTWLVDVALQTIRSLRAHALRFTLTSLGIFWGATMLTYLSASSAGTRQHFERQLDKTGPKTVWVIPGVLTRDRLGERDARPLALDPDDVTRLDGLAVIERASVEQTFYNQIVRSGQATRLVTVVGMDEDGLAIRAFEVAEGRAIQRRDVRDGARVAFLGAETKQRLFGRSGALGATIHVDGVPLRVIGVAARKGDQLMYMGDADDELVVLPYTTANRFLAHDDTVQRIVAAPRTRPESAASIAAIRSVTSIHHDFEPGSELALNFVDVFEIWSMLDLLFTALEVFMVGAGVVTLLVGAVGVMNIMLVVVGERIQEIGLRKALGASNRAIFVLFLAEAVAVSGLAGSAGALAGYLLVAIARASLSASSTMASRPVFEVGTTVAVVLSLVGVGVVAGLVPAIRAARVPPAESLRAL